MPLELLKQKTNDLKYNNKINLDNTQFEAAAEEAITKFNGVFFYHIHDHIGSLRALAKLMPIFGRYSVKYFFVEQPVEIWREIFEQVNKSRKLDAPEIIAIKFTSYADSWRRMYMEALFALYEAALNNGMDIIPVAPPISSGPTSSETLVQTVTTREAAILTNINRINLSRSKYIGLFGSFHIGMAVSLNIPSVVILRSEQSHPWQITHEPKFTIDKLILRYDEVVVQSRFDQNWLAILQYTDQLAQFATVAYKVPTVVPNSTFNNKCLWLAVGLGIAGMGLLWQYVL